MLGPGIPAPIEPPGLVAEREWESGQLYTPPKGFIHVWPLDESKYVEVKTPGGEKSARLEKLPWPVDFSVYRDPMMAAIDHDILRDVIADVLTEIKLQWQDSDRKAAAPGLMFFLRYFDMYREFFREWTNRDSRSSVFGLFAVTPNDIRDIESVVRSQPNLAHIEAYYNRVQDSTIRKKLAQYLYFPETSKQKHVLLWLEDFKKYDKEPPPFPDNDDTPGSILYRNLARAGQLLVVRIGFSWGKLEPGDFEDFGRHYAAIQVFPNVKITTDLHPRPALRIINIYPVIRAIAEAQADRYAAGIVLPALQRLHPSEAGQTILGATVIQNKIMSSLGGRYLEHS